MFILLRRMPSEVGGTFWESIKFEHDLLCGIVLNFSWYTEVLQILQILQSAWYNNIYCDSRIPIPQFLIPIIF